MAIFIFLTLICSKITQKTYIFFLLLIFIFSILLKNIHVKYNQKTHTISSSISINFKESPLFLDIISVY